LYNIVAYLVHIGIWASTLIGRGLFCCSGPIRVCWCGGWGPDFQKEYYRIKTVVLFLEDGGGSWIDSGLLFFVNGLDLMLMGVMLISKDTGA